MPEFGEWKLSYETRIFRLAPLGLFGDSLCGLRLPCVVWPVTPKGVHHNLMAYLSRSWRQNVISDRRESFLCVFKFRGHFHRYILQLS